MMGVAALLLGAVLAAPGPVVAVPGDVRVLRPPVDAARLALWRAASDQRPSLREFRAPILDRADRPLVLHATDAADAPIARIVEQRLARDGLRVTLVAALEERERMFEREDPAGIAARIDVEDHLRRAGFPVGLLTCWTEEGDEPLSRRVARELAEGRDAAVIAAKLAALPFAYRPTIPGFELATECGDEDAAAIRLQVSSASDYAEPGAGGALDVFRDLCRLLPDAEIVVGVETQHLAGVEREARALAPGRAAPITLVESPLPLAQWAQDNAKAGFAQGRVVWLAPRYASRGEDGSTFVAGENWALEGLAATGREVRVSRLLFQGGDLMAVRDPTTGKRSLLVGEAEVARNRALGLTRDEVLTAFRAEFGVESCIQLPAVSFHIDLELTVRAADGGLVACVLDTGAAARAVLHCAIGALLRAGLLDAEGARAAGEDLDADRHPEFFARIGPILEKGQHAAGRFALDFAQHFALGPTDSGVGNLERILLAIDLWTAARMGEAGADELGLDPDSFAYLSSLRRREADRLRVANALTGIGWRLVAIPGLSDERRSLDPLNGLQLRDRYLMPAYGGLFTPLDDLAEQSLAEAFGPAVRIQRVATGETQRRAGGLHCAASVEPRPRGAR
jgi:hypothetical protein